MTTDQNVTKKCANAKLELCLRRSDKMRASPIIS